MSQFAALNKLLERWRSDGYDWSQVEVWGVGYPGSEGLVGYYAGTSTEACFVDSDVPADSAWTAFGALQDDLIIIDQQGYVQHHVNLHSMSLLVQANRDVVDGWVRALLSHVP